MKKILSATYILLLMALAGCGKDPVETPAQEATTFPAPTWKADDTGKYPATMTAVVALPKSVSGTVTENDQLAAFIDNECRGLGVIVKVNNLDLFFVLIQGLSEESGKITFRYYSSKTSYMYESGPALNFLIDAVYGTAENPKTIELTMLK